MSEETFIENEDDFIDQCADAVTRLIPQIEKLEMRSLEKALCLTKAFELAFWLKQYKIEKRKWEDE